MTGWAFAQLRSFVEYKARLSGVRVVCVDPAHTSQECNVCGHIARANRRSQATFSCKQCGYTTNADVNAALNIRYRALVNAPEVAGRRPQQPWLLVRAQSVDAAGHEGAGASDKLPALAGSH